MKCPNYENRPNRPHRQNRHWKKVKPSNYNYEYSDMQHLWEMNIELERAIISCEGHQFYSLKEAAEYFEVSSERVRQKLKDKKYLDWKYLYKSK